MLKLLVLLSFVYLVSGDIYMHNPRGSNDRLNEQSTNRQNANRLFDSQNNAKGGYHIGPYMYYYSGSVLEIEWTNQHGCGGNSNVRCNVVIQYMCGDDVRDGTTTATIPEGDQAHRELVTLTTDEERRYFRSNDPDNPDQVYRYGMHENWQYYSECSSRSRNKGLFTADRNVGSSARSTRQSNGNNRRGFECNEERDYYPYWHPTPWIDIAVLTDDSGRCSYYHGKSENEDSRNYCSDHINNNEIDCEAAGSTWEEGSTTAGSGVDCHGPTTGEHWSRDNHLGNGKGGTASRYSWEISDAVISEFCVLRIRYNISTSDYDGWDTYSSSNGAASPVKQDPYVPYGEIDGVVKNLTLAIDTSQFGRTFQDRSHTFAIRDRDSTRRLYNLNVRGKRGNIVQTYPAVEYDFMPHDLSISVNDEVHIQWTGGDYQQDNDGEGRDRTDRSNIVEIDNRGANHPIEFDDGAMFNSDNQLLHAHLDQTNCKTLDELRATNNNNAGQMAQDVQNCMILNAASPYFDGGRHSWSTAATYHFMCSRNNNFSNRSQKGSVDIDPFLKAWAIALVVLSGCACLIAIVVSIVGFTARLLPEGNPLHEGWRKINFMKDADEDDVGED